MENWRNVRRFGDVYFLYRPNSIHLMTTCQRNREVDQHELFTSEDATQPGYPGRGVMLRILGPRSSIMKVVVGLRGVPASRVTPVGSEPLMCQDLSRVRRVVVVSYEESALLALVYPWWARAGVYPPELFAVCVSCLPCSPPMEHHVLLRNEPGENAMRNPMQTNLGLWCFHPIFSTFGSS